MAAEALSIDRERSAARIERDIETLAGDGYTRSSESIMRYAYTPEYRKTLDYFVGELQALGFEHYQDPVGTLIVRNSPKGEKVFGVGSHCDSNRNGGKYDGTMGVVTALEEAAEASGEPYMTMHSGAAHDTMSIADRIPSAMVFVPCKDGISHSPEEDADPADAALGAEVMLNAIRTLTAGEQ